MNLNTKLEVAVDIMASTVARAIKQGCDPESDYFKMLMEQKKEMYNCNEEVLDHIINVYGKKFKEENDEIGEL